MQRHKTKGSKGVVSQELLDEREERIHHLEEVNRTLKQTNDELTEEMGELREKCHALTAEVGQCVCLSSIICLLVFIV